MKRILDRGFKYVPAAATDIRKTFARIEREKKAVAEQEAKNRAEAEAKLRTLPKSRTA